MIQNKTVYFSYAYTTPNSIAESIKEKLIELGVNLTYYTKGTEYSDKPIKDCDAFIIFLPNNAFEAEISKLSHGVQKEIILAYRLKKDIILAYLSKMAGGVTFYLTEIKGNSQAFSSGIIKGISGTNSDVIKLLSEEQEINLGDADNLDWLTKKEINIIL